MYGYGYHYYKHYYETEKEKKKVVPPKSLQEQNVPIIVDAKKDQKSKV